MEKKKKLTKIVLYALLIALSLFMLVPFYWMVISSLKLNKDVFSIPMRWWPETMHPENYSVIWKKLPLVTFFANTTKLTVCTTIIQLCTSCFAAYGFTKCRFKGRDTLFLMYVTTIAVPWQVYMVPQFIMVSKMGLNDTHLGLILMQAFSAFGVFLIRQFYISIPDELCEAARIDGLNELGIFRRIIWKACHGHPYHFHLYQCVERFHGAVDLPQDKGTENSAAWNPYVYLTVRRRLCMDHGCLGLFPDSGCDCILKLSEVLRGRRCRQRH